MAFDPNQTVEVENPKFLGDLSDTAKNKELHESLEKGNFAKLEISDLSEFQVPSVATTTGEYAFSVEQSLLKDAVTTTRFTSQVKNIPNVARLTLSKDKLKISTFNPSSFSIYIIPLMKSVEGLNDTDQIRFIFCHNVLSKIVSTFTDDVITFVCVPEKQIVKVVSGKTTLEISTYPDSDFADFSSKIDNAVLKSQINPVAVREAIQNISTFSKKDTVQPDFSLVHIRDGEACGGTVSALAVVEDSRLEGYELKVKFELLSSVEKVLSFMSQDNTHLFETDTHYIIRDENILFGFEKTPHNFPPITGILNAPRTSKVLIIPSDTLQSSLQKLSVVSVNPEMLVKLTYQGLNNGGNLTLTTSDDTGKLSKDSLSINIKDSSPTPDASEKSFELTLNSFLKAISNRESVNIEMTLIEGKAAILSDTFDGVTTTTILSMIREQTA